MEKELTIKVTVVECERLVVTLMVLLPEPPLIGFVLNVALAPEGRPLTLKLTLPLKPPEAVTAAE